MVYGDSIVGTVRLEAGTVVRVRTGKPANRGGLRSTARPPEADRIAPPPKL
jgi:hypothetical protein